MRLTGLMPRITFGPNRRIGALGAYIVSIDPEKKLFPATHGVGRSGLNSTNKRALPANWD
jgi:hypothetical protein